jgi:circadian clock protein KaiC
LDVYLGPDGVLTGSARLSQEAREQADEFERRESARHRRMEVEAERKALAAQIAAIEAKISLQDKELHALAAREAQHATRRDAERGAMAQSRRADAAPAPGRSRTAVTKLKGRA